MSGAAEESADLDLHPWTAAPTEAAWQRLSTRIIWVDLIMSVLSVVPAVVAIWGFGVEASGGQIWPLIGLAVFGAVAAILDAVRWVFTSFRVTPTYVELKTGVVWRQHRSIRRDRIRSVDIEAKLRHRLARMRVVDIGAGQQSAAGESALSLDALSADDALALKNDLLSHNHLLSDTAVPATEPDISQQARTDRPTAVGDSPAVVDDDAGHHPAAPRAGEHVRVLARFEPSWFIYNMFNIWAYALALGLGWGAVWALSTVGVDLYGFVIDLADWESIGWLGTGLIAVVVVGALGAVGLGINYFTENWNLELARVPGRDGTSLRTHKGLITTREVNRDENRIRGVQISEPVLWRWMGGSDTSVITTGLDAWSMSEPAAILPRGPIRRAREVAGEVLGEAENPFDAQLHPHPRRALRRRLWWATLLTVVVGVVLTVLAVTDVVGYQAIWGAVAAWPVFLLAAVIAYRALGHRITDRFVVTRSGLLNRATTVLERSAVSTIVIRESLLQQRLGLRTVSTMTAAGYGGYDTPDLPRQRSLEFAVQAAPGLLDQFLTDAPERAPSRPGRGGPTRRPVGRGPRPRRGVAAAGNPGSR